MAVVTFTTRSNLTPGAVENIADVTNCLDKLLDGVNSVADTQLASPANAIWRTLQTWEFKATGGTPANFYFSESASLLLLTNGSGTYGTKQYQVSAADSAVAGKTTKYRWAYNYVTNSVAPGSAVTLDLRAVTGLTGTNANNTALTVGAAQPGPAVTFTPTVLGAASASTAVAIADGTYTLGVTLGGTTAATSYMLATVSLQMQHV